ncbi:MAG: hypothetical protein R3Y50_09565 [Rikenellaceae bacterium]
MSEKEQYLGEFSMTFKGRKAEDGDIILRTKKRNKPKGQTISGAAKMRSAYKKRMANKGGKR